jgi:SAM-dependent methyltransferase
MAQPALPLPPAALAARVGSGAAPGGSLEPFLTMGAGVRAELDRMLGPEWSWEDKRVLDFGCGVGRVLRHFTPEAERAEFVGCDIDEASIAWVQRHLCPPFDAFVNPERPPLELPDESFDLVYAISVFTHLSDSWSAWLWEMHRVLKPDGLLIATVLGGGMSREIAYEPWDPDRIGMNVLGRHRPWSEGGPSVLISEWWLRAHWGRIFDVLKYRAVDEPGQDFVLLRRREAQVSPRELEHPEPGEPRELAAVRHNVSQLHREARQLRASFEGSLSWRLTAPVRAAARRVRTRIGR